MDKLINCVPFALNWTEGTMSLKVDIMLKNPILKHERIIGKASVVLSREDVSETLFGSKYEISLIYRKISWFEKHEGVDVTTDDLLAECKEVADLIWDE